MARELGLGVTPWGPLRGGALSGKYTRENAIQIQPARGNRVSAYLNERTFRIVDELARIGRELAATPASAAVAWVQSRPGVTSTTCFHPNISRRSMQSPSRLSLPDLCPPHHEQFGDARGRDGERRRVGVVSHASGPGSTTLETEAPFPDFYEAGSPSRDTQLQLPYARGHSGQVFRTCIRAQW